MAYDNEKIKFGKEHIYIVEMDLEYCGNFFGFSPCTATASGDSKCYNTLSSCQDLPNFASSIKTYRFCESRSAHPIGLLAIPSLNNVSISPAKIDLGGGLGTRASVNLSFIDHPASDIGVDKYLADRTYIASERGSFWTKLRARNPNYQFKDLRVKSGYLVDGVYIAANFTTRYYIIESMNVSGGKASIIAKDPLKLASSKKALAPKASTGLTKYGLNQYQTNITLTPTGVGAEYILNPNTSIDNYIVIKSEVMKIVSRSNDDLTVVRGQYNTSGALHSANDTVQQCLEYSGQTRGQLDFIVKDLLTTYANIDTAFIDDGLWDAEVSTYLSGLLDGIITKPYDVFKLLKELAESMPHYLWWNEITQRIELTALKQPPITANVLNMDNNIIAGSFSTKDKQELRASTIFVNFGMFDPTAKLDEENNYQQSYVRVDTDSISKYGSSEIKVVNSRWISNTNKAAALQLAALYGRRFSDVPREIKFSLDAKDSDVWVGQTKSINHIDIVDDSGAAINTNFQIMSAKENKTFDYTGLEFTYGQELLEDEGGGDPSVERVLISTDSYNVNLRTLFNALYPIVDATTKALFIFEAGNKVGSQTASGLGVNTGTWPAGATVTIQLNEGSYIVGKGGDESQAGGTALSMAHPITLVNNGTIGGGGGGGGYATGSNYRAGGGGGAGYDIGIKGTTQSAGGSATYGENGTLETGGAGGSIVTAGSEPEASTGGSGGNLGSAGQNAFGDGTNTNGGAAGAAIQQNGFTLTITTLGDVRGTNS